MNESCEHELAVAVIVVIIPLKISSMIGSEQFVLPF